MISETFVAAAGAGASDFEQEETANARRHAATAAAMDLMVLTSADQ
jgi:hypothetical protein